MEVNSIALPNSFTSGDSSSFQCSAVIFPSIKCVPSETKLLRARSAGDAFAARFVAEELHGVEGLFRHVAMLGIDDKACAQRLSGAKCPE